MASALLPDGNNTVFALINQAVTGPPDAATMRHHILPLGVTLSDRAGKVTSNDTLNADEIVTASFRAGAVGSMNDSWASYKSEPEDQNVEGRG